MFPDGFVFGYDALISEVIGAMYAPEVWGGPEGAAALLDLLADAVLGDQAALESAAAVRATIRERLTPPGFEADYNNGFDGYFGNQCADTQYPSTFGGFLAIDRYAQAGSEFGPSWWWFNNGCTDWPVNEDRYAGPWTTSTSAPVLVVGNYFDGVTDFRGAR